MNVFENKVGIVTGGGMGLGKALCEELARRGSVVIVADIDGDAAEQVTSIVQTEAKARAVRIDVSQKEEVARLIETTVSEFGRLCTGDSTLSLLYIAVLGRGVTFSL